VLLAVLADLPQIVPDRLPEDVDPRDGARQVLNDDDLQLTLWVLYELHYRGFEEVDERWEWDPALLRFRAVLEERFEAALRDVVGVLDGHARPGELDVPSALTSLLGEIEAPSLASYIQREATIDQFREFMIARSIYHLKETDPHSWALPRLDGTAKARLAELLYDEYGAGRPGRLHATMFARSLESAGLNPQYGAYIDRVPAATLAVNNAMSLFGLHRRLRGAAMGHLAAFETTSSLPCRRFAMGIRRLQLDETVADYFDEHVEADAVHEQLALRDICGVLVAEDPGLAEDVMFGAATCARLDAVVAEQTLDAWQHGATSLVPAPTGAVA
jgi:hypothetical protein